MTKNCMVDSKSEYFTRFTHIAQHERVKRFTPCVSQTVNDHTNSVHPRSPTFTTRFARHVTTSFTFVRKRRRRPFISQSNLSKEKSLLELVFFCNSFSCLFKSNLSIQHGEKTATIPKEVWFLEPSKPCMVQSGTGGITWFGKMEAASTRSMLVSA